MDCVQEQETIRVMLIDDHQTMLWGLGKLIEGETPRMTVVGSARTCEDALRQAAQLAPDVIVLDIDLGGQSSVDIIPALLMNRVSRVLILTGTKDQDMLDLAIRRGARGILHKD